MSIIYLFYIVKALLVFTDLYSYPKKYQTYLLNSPLISLYIFISHFALFF